MKLTDLQKEISGDWKAKGYELPEYDREAVKKNTKENPVWVHFGAGNIFRAFPAEILQRLLNSGAYDKGVIVAESFDHEIITKAYKPYDSLSLSVVLKSNGTIEKKVVGSVVEALVADQSVPEDFSRLFEIFESPSLQIASFTITEKGYSLYDGKGDILPVVEAGFKESMENQGHLMGRIAALCYRRYQTCKAPIALSSMDNCSHNGDKLKAGVMAFVEAWTKNGIVEKEFEDFMKDPSKVSFPCSMIDKITPRPDENVKKMLEEDGFEDTELIITSRNTYTSPFVNSEETGYLVIEDSFPNGRPPLEKAGVLFTDKETVDKVERMKVCTCLNPLHTALAVYGCLLSHTSIHEEMKDAELSALIEKMCYEEGMPVVVDPGVIDPKDFAGAVLKLRFPNPFMPDSPQRIATDTSQKLSVRFGETIKSYLASDTLDVSSLTLIPLVLAGWCRYLMGVNDDGEKFEQSPDPLLEKVKKHVAGVKLGEKTDVHAALEPILKDETIFGVNLYEAGLGEKVEGMFAELTAGEGAIRSTLKKYVK